MNAFVVAIHESGHAAIAHALGRGCDGIDFYAVKNSDEFAGQLWPRYTDAFPRPPEDNWTPARIEAEVLILMGGEIAQQEFDLPVEEIGVSDDRERASQLVQRLVELEGCDFGDPRRGADARTANLRDRAAEIVRQHRGGIERLANTFMGGRPQCFVEGEEVEAVLSGRALSDFGE